MKKLILILGIAFGFIFYFANTSVGGCIRCDSPNLNDGWCVKDNGGALSCGCEMPPLPAMTWACNSLNDCTPTPPNEQ